MNRVARLYRIRPSDLLNGDLADFNTDMVMGLQALKDLQEPLKQMQGGGDDLGPGIAAAVAIGSMAGI